ncbi:hypothetical protein CK203_051732 [Vitis vinifera]|uniref:Uncharacterized protein n=1 Tax=Vitis vinifera TaxID=29760 RepID=A0A438HGC6_VITVI|nr:hypothetical protein CK203_051732 [Vitis vinifera]
MDVSLESKSLPSVGYSRKSYLQTTYQKLTRDKLVHLNGWRSLALSSVGPACSVWFPTAVTPSFQLRIAHRLKHWIADFLRFETKYSMHKLDFRKCSKSGSNDCHQECFMADFSLLPFLAFRICLWKRTSKLRFFMFLSFPFALPWIPKNSPQSWIALIQQHLGILPPPEHDMLGPSEPIAPSEEATPVEQAIPSEEATPAEQAIPSKKATPTEQTMPHEETTTTEVETPIQSTQETIAEPSSPHDPPTTT